MESASEPWYRADPRGHGAAPSRGKRGGNRMVRGGKKHRKSVEQHRVNRANGMQQQPASTTSEQEVRAPHAQALAPSGASHSEPQSSYAAEPPPSRPPPPLPQSPSLQQQQPASTTGGQEGRAPQEGRALHAQAIAPSGASQSEPPSSSAAKPPPSPQPPPPPTSPTLPSSDDVEDDVEDEVSDLVDSMQALAPSVDSSGIDDSGGNTQPDQQLSACSSSRGSFQQTLASLHRRAWRKEGEASQ